MKLLFVATLLCFSLLFSACGTFSQPSSAGSTENSVPVLSDEEEKPLISYAIERIPFAENLSLTENEVVTVLDATQNVIFFVVDEKIRGDAYSSATQRTKQLVEYNLQTQATTILQTFEGNSICYLGTAFGDAFIYCILNPDKGKITANYQIFLYKNNNSALISQGKCVNSPTATPDFAVYGNNQVAFSYANIDATRSITNFGIELVTDNGKTTELFVRKESEDSKFINSELCSNGDKLIYFVEENNSGLFYVFNGEGSATFNLEEGKKILGYAMTEHGVLFMLSANEDTDKWQRELSFFDFDTKQWKSSKSDDYYRMESNGEDLVLAINSSFDIYFLQNSNNYPVLLPDEVALKSPKNVRFFNIDSNNYFLFFEKPYELLQLTLT